jgi:uncharacterized membrane protein
MAPRTLFESPPRPRVGWRARLRRMLVAGLLILIPVAVTGFVLVQIFRFMDGIFAPIVSRVLGRALGEELPVHIPGLGLLLTLLLILVLGWLSTNVAGRRILRVGERMLLRLPVAKSIYGATKGILDAVAKDQTETFKRVVLIEYPKKDLFALAFVTGGARWGEVNERLGDLLLVFVPTTPNPTSGFLLLVPRGEAIDLPVAVEDGIRMVISGGILQPPLDIHGRSFPPKAPAAPAEPVAVPAPEEAGRGPE